MEISSNIYVNTYTAKIDNHIIEIEIHNCKKTDFISLWWNYNNNFSSIQLFYDINNNKLYDINNITDRQKILIIKKIKKAMELQKNIKK